MTDNNQSPPNVPPLLREPERPGEPAPSQAAPVVQKTHSLAIVAFVLALIPLCLIHVVGLILGCVAWSQISNRPRELTGKGFAVAAVLIGSFWTLLMVVGVFAAIAIPSFLKYQTRAKQTEARAELTSLRAAESAYQTEKGTYGSFSDVNWKPGSEKRYYSYYLGAESVPATVGEPSPLPDGVVTSFDKEGFKAAAVGNLDSDPALDVWIIDASGALQNLVDDTTEGGSGASFDLD